MYIKIGFRVHDAYLMYIKTEFHVHINIKALSYD